MPTSKFGAWAIPVVAKTGNYTLLETDAGRIFTTRGAGAGVTFTLPKTAPELSGVWFEFYTVAAQIMTIASNPADDLIVHADTDADTIATAATIGQHIKVICDGTGWLVISNPSAASAGTAVTAVTLVS